MADQNEKSPGRTASDAIKAAVDIAKASAKAAAGDLGGAATDLLKNKQIRQTIIAIVLLLCFVLMFLSMGLGAAIIAVIMAIIDMWCENWDANWQESGIASNGNVLHLYIVGGPTAFVSTAWDTLVGLFKKDDGNPHTSEVLNQDYYDDTINSVKDYEALAGKDGALMDRLNLIKGRVKERGEQVVNETEMEYLIEAYSLTIANRLYELFHHPFLYAGVDWDNCDINIDKSVFELSDIQSLKILAAYCVQHDCDMTEIDMWDLMDYCGWYNPFIEDKDDDFYTGNNTFNKNCNVTALEEICGIIKPGDRLDERVEAFETPTLETWSGTCAPQWYYEEKAQIKDYKDRYDLLLAAGETDAIATMYPIPVNKKGEIDYSAFQKLKDTKTYGLVNYIYTASNASMLVSRSPYEGIDAPVREFLEMLKDAAFGLWTQWDAANQAMDPMLRQKNNGKHCVVTWNIYENNGRIEEDYFAAVRAVEILTRPGVSLTVRRYSTLPMSQDQEIWPTIINEETKDTNAAIDKENNYVALFEFLRPNEHYEVYFKETKVINGQEEVVYTYYESFDTIFGENSQNKYQSYKLRFQVNITYAARSLDEIAVDLLGLWPGALQDKISGPNGLTYAQGHTGNTNLVYSWTDTFTDANGKKRTLTFDRLQGYQYESYIDYITGVASMLNIDTAGMILPQYGPDDSIVSVALKEYEYYSANKMYGGKRYWQVLRSKLSHVEDTDPWNIAFVLGCAYQCGYLQDGGCFSRLDEYGWPTWCVGFMQAMEQTDGAMVTSSTSFKPRAGDLVFFGTSVGDQNPSRVAIVVDITHDGKLVTIEGDYDGKVARKTYDTSKIGESHWVEHEKKRMVITHFMRLNHSALRSQPPAYKTVQGDIIKQTDSAYVLVMGGGKKVLLAGYPRFRISQLYSVIETIKKLYPDVDTEKVIEAVNEYDTAAFVQEWYNLIVEFGAAEFSQMTFSIAAQLFVEPIIKDQRIYNSFDWAKTEVREEIVKLLASTTDQAATLSSVLARMTKDFDNSVSDHDLLKYLMTDNRLRNLLEASADGLWPTDPEALRTDWLKIVDKTMNEIRNQYLRS